MSQKVFIWIAPFTAHRSILESFRTFMEINHFLKLHKTGHFEEDFSVLVEDTDDPDFVLITYTHVLKKGEIGWELYQLVRPPIKAHFLEHCGEAMKSKNLIPGEQKTEWIDSESLVASPA